MTNKNKFILVTGPINILMLAILLNSCHTGVGAYNMTKDPVTPSVNGSNINGTCTYSKNSHEHTSSINEKQAACPNCEIASRFLYKLANKENSLILICEECTSVWLDSNKIGWGETADDEKLKSRFGIKDSQILFNPNYSAWATKEEAERSEWKKLVRSNELLIK